MKIALLKYPKRAAMQAQSFADVAVSHGGFESTKTKVINVSIEHVEILYVECWNGASSVW